MRPRSRSRSFSCLPRGRNTIESTPSKDHQELWCRNLLALVSKAYNLPKIEGATDEQVSLFIKMLKACKKGKSIHVLANILAKIINTNYERKITRLSLYSILWELIHCAKNVNSIIREDEFTFPQAERLILSAINHRVVVQSDIDKLITFLDSENEGALQGDFLIELADSAFSGDHAKVYWEDCHNERAPLIDKTYQILKKKCLYQSYYIDNNGVQYEKHYMNDYVDKILKRIESIVANRQSYQAQTQFESLRCAFMISINSHIPEDEETKTEASNSIKAKFLNGDSLAQYLIKTAGTCLSQWKKHPHYNHLFQECVRVLSQEIDHGNSSTHDKLHLGYAILYIIRPTPVKMEKEKAKIKIQSDDVDLADTLSHYNVDNIEKNSLEAIVRESISDEKELAELMVIMNSSEHLTENAQAVDLTIMSKMQRAIARKWIQNRRDSLYENKIVLTKSNPAFCEFHPSIMLELTKRMMRDSLTRDDTAVTQWNSDSIQQRVLRKDIDSLINILSSELSIVKISKLDTYRQVLTILFKLIKNTFLSEVNREKKQKIDKIVKLVITLSSATNQIMSSIISQLGHLKKNAELSSDIGKRNKSAQYDRYISKAQDVMNEISKSSFLDFASSNSDFIFYASNLKNFDHFMKIMTTFIDSEKKSGIFYRDLSKIYRGIFLKVVKALSTQPIKTREKSHSVQTTEQRNTKTPHEETFRRARSSPVGNILIENFCIMDPSNATRYLFFSSVSDDTARTNLNHLLCRKFPEVNPELTATLFRSLGFRPKLQTVNSNKYEIDPAVLTHSPRKKQARKIIDQNIQRQLENCWGTLVEQQNGRTSIGRRSPIVFSPLTGKLITTKVGEEILSPSSTEALLENYNTFMSNL